MGTLASLTMEYGQIIASMATESARDDESATRLLDNDQFP